MTILFTETHYKQQFIEKVNYFNTMMAEFNAPTPTLFTSPIKHYRMRAEFRIWHEDDDLFYVMFEAGSQRIIKITQFEIASSLINQAMPMLLNYIKDIPTLRYKLFRVDYLSTLSGQLLITLLYHKQLDNNWRTAASLLHKIFNDNGFDVRIVGRALKQKISIPCNYVDEELIIKGKPLIYRQVENAFTQPNTHININMLEWALDVTKNSHGDLLEFYCGNGNFSLTLAANFRFVLATEIAKSSVEAAQYNVFINEIDNVTILRMSAKELTQALQGVRQFTRLKGINLCDYDCQTVLVDPPRSGLDINTLTMINNYDKIIYISCNSLTLKENLKILTQTHYLTNMALFDQFPYTSHLESAVVLKKKK